MERAPAILAALCWLFASASAYTWQEKWFDSMPVDHFCYDSADTFRLRYLINTDWWKRDGGPLFVYCGNEGSIDGFANNTGFMWDIAESFGAMLVFIEHRYYGKSLPYGEEYLKNLGKLSSSQALADFAVLITWLKSNVTNATSSPVIVFGGSYGGMLAAWMRIKYPHIVDGAIAASAPVAQFPGLTSCSTFSDIASEVFRNASNSCSSLIKQSWQEIRKLGSSAKGRANLADIFHLCNQSDLSHRDNVTQLVDWLSDVYGSLAMVNYPYDTEFLNPVPGWPVKVACSYLNDTQANGTTLLRNVYSAISVYLNYTGQKKCNTFDPDYGASVDNHVWDYQACSEMLLPMCNRDSGMFEPSEFNLTKLSDDCFAKYKVRPVGSWAPINYGGRNLSGISNIVFSNGWLDPWRGGGILTSTRGVAALIVEDGAHHYDLRGRHPKDTESVRNVRLLEVGFIKKWVQTAALRLNRTKW